MRVAIIRSPYYSDLCNTSTEAARQKIVQLAPAASVKIYEVHGALELPVLAAAMARRTTGRPDAIVAIGCVIRGETFHFEIVSTESARGLMRVGIDFDMPIGNGIMTTNNFAQAEARAQHTGAAAAQGALDVLFIKNKFEGEKAW